MIDRYIDRFFTESPEEAEFQQPFGELISEVEQSLDTLTRLSNRAVPDKQAYIHGQNLYIKTQAMIRVLLNYKICIEFGLPLHPTIYFDLFSHDKDPGWYSERMKRDANKMYRKAIAAARSVYNLEREARTRLSDLGDSIPEEISDFIYTNRKDKYTWKASSPDAIKKLAQNIRDSGEEFALILGAAHGCIRPGLLLANLLDTDLYFIRYSAFKRKDKEPIISEADRKIFGQYRDRKVLLFDEDVAKGVTLRTFKESVKDHFGETKTAAVLRHFISPYTPDYVGEHFFD